MRVRERISFMVYFALATTIALFCVTLCYDEIEIYSTRERVNVASRSILLAIFFEYRWRYDENRVELQSVR